VNNQSDRAEIVAALECVDLVTIFPEEVRRSFSSSLRLIFM